jgi:hypothetical protein
MSNPLESSKKEVSLEINSFDKPAELSNVAAWSQLLLNLIFLKPGTYPSLPEMGVGIESFQYDFLEDTISALSARITEQHKNYLSDVPLARVQISKMEQNGQPILIIQLYFNTDSGAASSAIAINISKRNFLEFEVSW